MSVIRSLRARQVLDCRARPLLEVELRTEGGRGVGASPTGQSVGAHEAVLLRDNDPAHYGGLTVHRAVQAVEQTIASELIGKDIKDQAAFDAILLELDGTPDKRNLGGNTLCSTSIAFLRAQANEREEQAYRLLDRGPLTRIPVPTFNVINGGRNDGVVQAFNEFIVVPFGAADIEEAVEMGVRIFDTLGPIIEAAAGRASVGKSFGYIAPYSDPARNIALIEDAVAAAGLNGRVAIALDCASSEMYDEKTDTYELAGDRVSADALIDYVRILTEEHSIVFVEDLLAEDDWAGFQRAVARLSRTLVLGDDLIASNRSRLERAIQERSVDGFILKPNQVGTISESVDSFDAASAAGLITIPSGRSGGVVDDICQDLAVGLQVPFMKNGAPRSGERIAGANFLLRAGDDLPGSELVRLESIIRF
jgi:enolase